MVVLYHLHPHLLRMGYQGAWPGCLASGVDIFFLISGFIMWLTTSQDKVDVSIFYKKRFVRIVPLYWALTVLVVVLLFAAPAVLQTSVFSFYHVVTSFLFYPSVHPIKGVIEPLVMTGWTLNYEMFFYLIFGAFLFLNQKIRVLIVSVFFASIVLVGYLWKSGGVAWEFYTNSIVLEFVFGVLLGYFFTNGRNAPPHLALFFLCVGVFSFLYPISGERLWLGLLAMVFPRCLLLWERSCMRDRNLCLNGSGSIL